MLFALLKFRTKSHSVKIFVSTIKYQSDNSRWKWKSIVFTYIFPYCLLSSFWYSSFLLSLHLSSQPIWVVLLVTNSLSFLATETVLISPSFLEDIFIRYRILGLHLFSFSTWKMVSLPFGLYGFECATHYHLGCVSTVGRFFSFSAIKISSLYLTSGICFCCVSSWFPWFFSVRSFAQDLESLARFEKYLSSSFSPPSSFTRTLMTPIYIFLLYSHRLLKCYSFFSPFSLCCLDWITPILFSNSQIASYSHYIHPLSFLFHLYHLLF